MNLQNVEGISIPSEAIAALENGNRVEAVRIIRDADWITLKQAGNAADAFLDANPELKARYLDRQSAAWTGFVYFVALLSVGAIIAQLLI